MGFWTTTTPGYTWAEAVVGGDELPVGAIAMWSALNGAIPADWAECDGVANAPGPDLRNFFVVGRGTKTVDTSGGAATHAHTDNLTHAGTAVGNHAFTQPGAHTNHVFTQPSAHGNHTEVPSHSHSHSHNPQRYPTATGANIHFTVDTSMSGTPTTTTLATTADATINAGAANAVHTNNHAGGAVDAHSAHSGGAVDAHAITQPSAHGSHAATNSEPAWYALIYIQRMT